MDGPRLEAKPRALLLLLLIVILCLCDCEAGKKKKHCKYNGKKYESGEVIVALEDNCVEIKCSKWGINTELEHMKNCDCSPQATFSGPYNNISNDQQCRNILNYKPQSLSDCELKCKDTTDCTAINYTENDCTLSACTYPIPEATWNLPPWKRYKIDEGEQEEILNTAMDFIYNANIPLNEKAAKKKKPCKYNRKKYMPGKVIEVLEDNCVELKCSRKGKNTVLELIKTCACGTEECFPTCQNGGTCSETSVCQCPEGWSGAACDKKECTPKCQNGGLCSASSVCQCPEGWMGDACDQIDCGSPWVSLENNKECYLFVQNHMNWDSARSYCIREGGDLAVLDTEDKRRYVLNYIESRGCPPECQFPFIYKGISYSACTAVKHDEPWCATETDDYDNYIRRKWKNCDVRNCHPHHIGANDRAGFWEWLNGEKVTSGWRRLEDAQPDDDRGDDTCMYLYTGSYPSERYDLLSDYKCTKERYFICEKNTTATVQKVEVYNVIYETDIARVLSHPGSSKVTTIINNSNTPQTTTTVITVKYERTRKWEFSLALALGVSTSIKTGHPYYAEFTFTFSAVVTTTGTVGETYTKTEEHQVRATIEVPANSRTTAWIRYKEYKVDIPYTASLKQYYVDGSTNIVQISGVYEGVHAAEFVVLYGETESII